MSSSGGSNRPFLLFAAVAIATTSVNAIAYRYFWYRTKDQRHDGDDLASKSNTRRCPQVQIKPPLRNTNPLPGEQPRIIYLTGIDKQTDEPELVELFSIGGTTNPIEIDASEVSFQKGGGRAWALYSTSQDAKKAVDALHGKSVRGCSLCARLEWGVQKDGKRITDKTTHTAILRGIQRRRGTPKKAQAGNETTKSTKQKKKKSNGSRKKRPHRIDPSNDTGSSSEYVATYSHNSISIGEIEYPFPSGIYSTKLIQRLSSMLGRGYDEEDELQKQQREQDEKLLRLLSDVSIIGCGSMNRYAKEVSEAFAMVDALERGIKMTFGVGVSDLPHSVTCYCLGDGKYPIGAAAFELFLPKQSNSNGKSWKYIAIDPLLPKPEESSSQVSKSSANGDKSTANATSMYHDKIELFSGLSQYFSIENTSGSEDCPVLSIAIACHSHAPLEEFWERMPKPKLCVALPCCAQFSELPKETPILEYDNFEIYSAKRRIKIFAST